MRALVVLLSVIAVAAPAEARRLSLEEALAMARRNSRDLVQARARLEQSATNIEAAWTALLPTATAQGKYTHNYKEVVLDFSHQNDGLLGLAGIVKTASPAQAGAVTALENAVVANAPANPVIQKQDQLDATLALTVPLVVPSAYPALASAKRAQAAAESGYAATEATVLLAAAQAFYAAAGSDELVVARRHAVDVARQALAIAKAKFDAQTVNRVEVARAELALLRADQALAEAADTQAQAHRALGTILVTREPLEVAVDDRAFEAGSDSDAAGLARQALALRPEFAQLERTIAADDDQALASRLRWLPTLSAFGNVHAFNYAGFSGDNYSWAAGAALDWTIYDGGARDAARHLARAQRRETEARLSLLRDTVADDVWNAHRTLTTKRRALATARESVRISRETLALVAAQHDAGTATQLDLLQAQDALVAAEVAQAQAHFDLALADLTLRRNAGTFPGG
jgi:outer membrane protein TolC